MFRIDCYLLVGEISLLRASVLNVVWQGKMLTYSTLTPPCIHPYIHTTHSSLTLIPHPITLHTLTLPCLSLHTPSLKHLYPYRVSTSFRAFF